MKCIRMMAALGPWITCGTFTLCGSTCRVPPAVQNAQWICKMVMWSHTLANLWRRAHAHKCVYDCYSSPVQTDFSRGLDPASCPAPSPIIRHHVGGCSLTRGLADGLSVQPGQNGGRLYRVQGYCQRRFYTLWGVSLSEKTSRPS